MLTRLAPLATCGALLLAVALPAQKKLTTTFASNNGGSSGWTCYFDIRVTNETGISIVGIEINTNATAATVNTPMVVEFYTCPLTYIGNEANITAWTLQSTPTGPAQLRNTPTPLALPSPLHLPAGFYGVALYVTGLGPTYTGTSSTGPFAVFANADITLTTGMVKSTKFLSTGSTFTPRTWNGSIVYNVQPNSSTLRTFGAGCMGSNGVPSLDQAAASWPKLNTTLTLALKQLPTAPSAVFAGLGASDTTFLGLNLPFDLTVLGMAGCSALSSQEVQSGGINTGGTGLIGIGIPNDARLLGILLFLQAFVPDPGANGLGLTTTNAVAFTIGT